MNRDGDLEMWEPPKPRDPLDSPAPGSCPRCHGPVVRGPIPCPEGKPGCCVLHYGLKCASCGALLR